MYVVMVVEEICIKADKRDNKLNTYADTQDENVLFATIFEQNCKLFFSGSRCFKFSLVSVVLKSYKGIKIFIPFRNAQIMRVIGMWFILRFFWQVDIITTTLLWD